MKFSLCSIILLSQVVLSQNIQSEYVVGLYEEDPLLPGIEITRLPMNFDESNFIDRLPKTDESFTIERVDLLYSEYQESESFDQKELNRRRIHQLIKAWPQVKDPLIDWRIIGQSDGRDNASARQLFHGFVIYYRSAPTKKNTAAELRFMDDFLKKVIPDDLSSIPSMSKIASSSLPSGPPENKRLKQEKANHMRRKYVTPPEDEHPKLTHMRNRFFQNECYKSFAGIKYGTSKELEAFVAKINVSGGGRTGLKYHYSASNGHEINTLHYVFYDLKPECDTSSRKSSSYEQFNDLNKYKAAQSVFDRNPKWTNTLVVMDVTGSMARYTAETLSWIKVTRGNRKIGAYIFFNDGDSTENDDKLNGSVGGIYGLKNASFEKIYDEVKTSMTNGNGGDRSENNFEATLYGQREFPFCKDIVMIADNRATPRDEELVKSINSPLHIILCGANEVLNISYIRSAWATKGSIHTSKNDYDLSQIKIGQEFSLGLTKYTWVGSKIVEQ